MWKYLDKISKMNEDNILWLDEIVLWALELFENVEINKLNINQFKKPLIAGSWNAIVTAKIIFSNTNAIFCDETTFDNFINKDIDWLIILSASWEKHASIFAQKAIEKWIKTILLTCNWESTWAKIVWINNTIITPKNKEPYTYNTSTYMWWVFAITSEDPKKIKEFILNKIEPIINNINFSEFDSYLLATPNNFSWINQLFNVKFIELFWRKIARDVFSYEHLKHAITVVPHPKELYISFWKNEYNFIWNSLNIPLPDDCDLWLIMAIWYYLIWKIQNSYPPYFKQYIWDYIKNVNKTDFWKNLKVIVE